MVQIRPLLGGKDLERLRLVDASRVVEQRPEPLRDYSTS
jgi:hypothetical protein